MGTLAKSLLKAFIMPEELQIVALLTEIAVGKA